MSRRNSVLIDSNLTVESDDEGELCRLLQLVLGCAVRCERQEEFIQAILQMEEDVQRGIMAAIQGLPGIELAGGSLADMAGRSPSQTAAMGYHNLISQLEAANDEKDLLVKKHQQQNRQVNSISFIISSYIIISNFVCIFTDIRVTRRNSTFAQRN